MFKKTLIAAALAATSTGAMAINLVNNNVNATLTTLTQTYGNEALVNGSVKNDGSALTIGATGSINVPILTLGAEYTAGDTITLSLAGAKFKKTETFSLTQNAVLGGANEITLGFLSASDTELTFRVTGVTGVTTGLQLILDDGTFVFATSATVTGTNAIILDSTAVGATATLSAKALTGTGLVIDSVGANDSIVISTVVQEHKFTVASPMDAKIDVALKREQFASATAAQFAVTYAANTADQAKYSATGATFTLNGSFTGFEKSVAATDNDGTIMSTFVFGTPSTGTELTVAADLQSAATANIAVASNAFGFTIGSTADRSVLNVGAYTVDVLLTDGTDTTTYAGISAGTHALNGASENFGYVPVNYDGAVTTQFEIGNKGTIDGEITLTAFDTAGMKYSKVLDFKAEAGKLTKISDADISTAFALTAGTKLKLTITVNSPASNISMAGYSNRGTTGRMAINSTIN